MIYYEPMILYNPPFKDPVMAVEALGYLPTYLPTYLLPTYPVLSMYLCMHAWLGMSVTRCVCQPLHSFDCATGDCASIRHGKMASRHVRLCVSAIREHERKCCSTAPQLPIPHACREICITSMQHAYEHTSQSQPKPSLLPTKQILAYAHAYIHTIIKIYEKIANQLRRQAN
jgi:hypothetical protein